MGKFPFKRPRIISKKFPEMDSTIDGVTKSLNDLVFSYADRVDRSLQKKHILMAASSLTLLLVLGSFISPKGKADSSIFYPETCLGGWVNPQLAQGEQQTTSNGDETQFTSENSAVLPKNTNAEMYCGNFKGKFDTATKPTKIIVSLALTKGAEAQLLEMGTSTLLASSTDQSIDLATTTEENLLLASSTDSVSTSTPTSTSTQEIEVTASTTVATSTESSSTSSPKVPEASSTEIVSPEVPPSIMEGIINSLQSVSDTINTFFDSNSSPVQQTDTVVIPLPPSEVAPSVPTPEPVAPPAPASTEPTSVLPRIRNEIISYLFQSAFAEEVDAVAPQEHASSSVEVVSEESSSSTVLSMPELIVDKTISSSTLEILNNISSSTLSSASSTFGDVATTTDNNGTTTQETATTTEENQFQNNFLEVFYTFDGVTWVSLGELNEISMKYRTFEIPVSATTSWSDMDHLQVKVVAIKKLEDTPAVYLDAIKVEVLYETSLNHIHPDFARDTILKDEIIDGVRIVTIINNDTNIEEVWYMMLEEIVSSTSTLLSASSTIATSTEIIVTPPNQEGVIFSGTSSEIGLSATSTQTEATSSPVVNLLTNKWKKYEGKIENPSVLPAKVLIEEIKKQEEEQKQKVLEESLATSTKDMIPPDFSLDIIKKIQGTFLNAIVVQITREAKDELWLYDIENNTQEKLDVGTSTSLSTDSPLGVKGGYIFWLSMDKKDIFAYTIATKEILKKEVPEFNEAEGERGDVTFENIPWKVIISNGGFSFFSEGTGEVFSDDDGSVAEALRQKLNLDSVLDEEELGNLNLKTDKPQPNQPEE